MPSPLPVVGCGPRTVAAREHAPVLLRPEWVFAIARDVEAFVRSHASGVAPAGGLDRFFTALPPPERALEQRILQEFRDSLAHLLHGHAGRVARAERARQLLIDEYRKPWTLARLARAVGCNRTTLQEEFRQLTRTTVHRFLVHRRVAVAQQLLCESDLKASRIALEVGYRSHSAFARHFKSVTGLTLTTFRVEQRRPAAV